MGWCIKGILSHCFYPVTSTENNHSSGTCKKYEQRPIYTDQALWARGVYGPGTPTDLPPASLSAHTDAAGRAQQRALSTTKKRLLLGEKVQEQAKSTAPELEKDRAVPSCTTHSAVLGPVTFRPSQGLLSQDPHFVHGDLSLSVSSCPVLLCPWFHFPSCPKLPFYGFRAENTESLKSHPLPRFFAWFMGLKTLESHRAGLGPER